MRLMIDAPGALTTVQDLGRTGGVDHQSHTGTSSTCTV